MTAPARDRQGQRVGYIGSPKIFAVSEERGERERKKERKKERERERERERQAQARGAVKHNAALSSVHKFLCSRGMKSTNH